MIASFCFVLLRFALLRIASFLATAPATVEHKDRLTRFGFNYIEKLLAMQGRRIEVINCCEELRGTKQSNQTGKEDLIQDFVSIITSFCARLYGQRRSKRKTERIIAELRDDKESDNASQI